MATQNRPTPHGPVTGSPVCRLGYVGGSSHSGSTLLTLLLDAHPDVHSIGQPGPSRRSRHLGLRNETCSCGEKFEDCPWLQGLGQRLAAGGYDFDPYDWRIGYELDGDLGERIAFGLLGSSLLGSMRHGVRRRLPKLRARFAETDRRNLAYFEACVAASGSPVLVDASKDPERLRFLRELPIDLRLIHLVRDPRAVAHSAETRGKDVPTIADHWATTQLNTESRARDLGSDRSFVLRYEDLCADPRGRLDEMFRFLDVPTSLETELPDPDDFRSGEHHVAGGRTRKSSAGRGISARERWPDELHAATQDLVWERTGTVAQRFGYER